MNIRLAAGVAILTLLFGGIFAAAVMDIGWLGATVAVLGAIVSAALVITATVLIADGMDRR